MRIAGQQIQRMQHLYKEVSVICVNKILVLGLP